MNNSVLSANEIKELLFPIFQANPVYRAILFGSYAKGNQTDGSDIDIVIDSQGELLNIEFYGLLEEISETTGKSIDLFEISEIKNNNTIRLAVEKEGLLLYDRQGYSCFK